MPWKNQIDMATSQQVYLMKSYMPIEHHQFLSPISLASIHYLGKSHLYFLICTPLDRQSMDCIRQPSYVLEQLLLQKHTNTLLQKCEPPSLMNILGVYNLKKMFLFGDTVILLLLLFDSSSSSTYFDTYSTTTNMNLWMK